MTARAVVVVAGILACSGAPAPQPTTAVRLPAEIVDLATVDPTIRVNLIYLGSANFLGRPAQGYRANVCYLTRDTAKALAAAQARLRARKPGHALLVTDCYRPKKAVDDFVAWAADEKDDATRKRYYPDLSKPELLRQGYIASPSGHTRATVVDLTIVDPSGTRLDMGSEIDFFGERSHTDFAGVSAEQRAARRLLVEVMSPEFENFDKEWWHFKLKDAPEPVTPYDFEVAR